jgi:hypothetical protein
LVLEAYFDHELLAATKAKLEKAMRLRIKQLSTVANVEHGACVP